jgi:hypothetical protein
MSTRGTPKSHIVDIQYMDKFHTDCIPRQNVAFCCSPYQLIGFLGLLLYCYTITSRDYKVVGFTNHFYTAISYHSVDGIKVVWDSISNTLKIKIEYQQISHDASLSARNAAPPVNDFPIDESVDKKIICDDFNSSFKRKVFYETALKKYGICCGYERNRRHQVFLLILMNDDEDYICDPGILDLCDNDVETMKWYCHRYPLSAFHIESMTIGTETSSTVTTIDTAVCRHNRCNISEVYHPDTEKLFCALCNILFLFVFLNNVFYMTRLHFCNNEF